MLARSIDRSIGRISKIGESYFNDTIRIPEFAFWVTCRSSKGERAREWLHRVALLEARDYRPPFRNEKERERERETSKGIRPLRLSGIVVGRVILQMFDRKPALGRLQTCFCNVEPRISVSRGIVFFFPPFPYREGQSKLSAASPRHKIRQGRITSH